MRPVRAAPGSRPGTQTRWLAAGAALLLLAGCTAAEPDGDAPPQPTAEPEDASAGQLLADPTCALGEPPEEPDAEVAQDPVAFQVVDGIAVMTGTIGADFVHRVCDLTAANPTVSEVEMLDVPGSSTPGNESLDGGLVLRAEGLDTVLPGDGIVESGGVDVFLAGNDRTVADGGCLGVHATEFDFGDGPLSAADLPRDDPEHAPYLEYFAAIGIPADFYWFTLAAAPPDGIHYLTPAEMAQFGVVTGAAPEQPCPLPDDPGGAG
jgi:hypothetical protein